MEAVALHDFDPNNVDELPFKRNQVLKVLSINEDPGWYLAEYQGTTGLVPNNYVSLRDNSWYVPNCTRQMAEDILLKRKPNGDLLQPDGAFLVRTSETTAPDFSLSVKYSGQVQHFKVLKDETGKYHLWFYKFDSINKIIEHHRTHSVSQTNNSMVLRDMLDAHISNNNNNISNSASANSNLLLNNAVVIGNNTAPVNAPPSSSSSNPNRVIALYDFTPQDPDELSFNQNDVITVLGKEDDSWWLGETQDGRRGVFPYNYVQPH